MQELALRNEADRLWHGKGRGMWAGIWVLPDLPLASLDPLKPIRSEVKSFILNDTPLRSRFTGMISLSR